MASKVSIIITTYIPKSKRHLDLCIKSIKSLNYPPECLEIILVGKKSYMPEYEGVKTICPEQEEFFNPVGVNLGMNSASKNSKYLVMANDDVVFTRDWLTNMVNAAGDNDVILGSLSNCDQHGHYQLIMPFDKRQYSYEELEPHIDELINAKSFYPPGFIFPSTLYLYANLFPAKVWAKVKNGTTPDSIGFDQRYRVGWDDSDYCRRAKMHGVRLAICLDSIIWHYSGTSAASTVPMEDRLYNESFYREKWGDNLY
jgi:GT2 family glycosyltransferase